MVYNHHHGGDDEINSCNMLSPKELVIHLRDKQIRAEIELGLDQISIRNMLQEEIKDIANKYQPVIRVFHIARSRAAHEILSQNLQLRIARKSKQDAQK